MPDSDPLSDIISGEINTVSLATNPLARSWRRIMSNIGLIPSRFEMLLDNFVSSVYGTIGEDAVRDVKGNLVKSLEARKLTWATFVRGLAILNYRGTFINISVHKGDWSFNYVIEIPVPGGLGSFVEISFGSMEDTFKQLQTAADVIFPVIESEFPKSKSKKSKSQSSPVKTWNALVRRLQEHEIDHIMLKVEITDINKTFQLRVKL